MTNNGQILESKRRLQLINATIESISEHGLSEITLAKVASRAGLSPGIVNFYFKSKQQLLLNTLEHLDQEFTAVIDDYLAKSHSPKNKLHAIIQANFDERLFTSSKVAVWYAFSSESLARKDYQKVCSRSDTAMHKCIRDLYSELLSPTDPKVEPLARGLEGVIEGFWQQSLYDKNSVNRDDAIATCKQYLQFTLGDTNDASELNVETNLETVELLAPWTYQNEELYQLEVDQLFRKSWILVAHVCDLPEAGSYITLDAVGERALVIRGNDGEIRAFHNVCRHRGARIVEGEGRCLRALICPFHGWRYSLEGAVKFIPGKNEGFSKLKESDYGLVPLDLEIWNGFIFIRFQETVKSVADELHPVIDQIKHYQLEELKPYQPSTNTVLPYNWKVYMDVDNEGYHVPIGHPALQQLYGHAYIDTAIERLGVSYGPFNEKHGNRWSVYNYRKFLPQFDHLPDDYQELWMYVAMFPNTVFALYPDMMETYQVFPTGVNECVAISRTYALEDPRREVAAARYLNQRINNETANEDQAYMLWLQQGMKSSAYPKWTLSETAETGVAAYHYLFQEIFPVAKLANEPQAGTVAKVNASLSG